MLSPGHLAALKFRLVMDYRDYNNDANSGSRSGGFAGTVEARKKRQHAHAYHEWTAV